MASTKRKTTADADSLAAARGGQFLHPAYINSGFKYTWRCGAGHVFEARYDDIRSNKSWCPDCSGMRRKTLADAQVLAATRGGKCLAETFPNTRDKILWACAEGHTWSAPYYSIQDGHWCPSCGDCAKHTVTSLNEVAVERGGVLVSDTYENAHQKLSWCCAEGHIFDMRANSVLTSQWCPTCADTTGSLDELQAKASQNGGACLETAYVNRWHRYLWRCQAGHEWRTSASNVLGGTWCRACDTEARRQKTLGKAIAIAISKKGALVPGTPYTSNKDVLTWTCSKHHTFNMNGNDIDQGHWCPRCSLGGRPSQSQIEIYNFVESLGLKAVLDSRAVVPPKEIDIWVPEKRVAIEFNGLYWHSDALSGFKPGRERDKAEAVVAAGHQFFMIYEDEWRDKRALVEAMLRQRLGVATTTKLNARALELRAVSDRDLHPFFDLYHLDGHARCRGGFGLFLDDVMVMAASVRVNFRHERELARLATHTHYSVRGGAGRLIQALRASAPGPLYSFSNNRLSSGAVYKKLGFVEVTETKTPSYYYTDGAVRVWRYQCRRLNAASTLARFPDVPHNERAQALAGMHSERLFGDRRPLFRVEDCGHRKWRLG